jgi:hypothetical protein
MSEHDAFSYLVTTRIAYAIKSFHRILLSKKMYLTRLDRGMPLPSQAAFIIVSDNDASRLYGKLREYTTDAEKEKNCLLVIS